MSEVDWSADYRRTWMAQSGYMPWVPRYLMTCCLRAALVFLFGPRAGSSRPDGPPPTEVIMELNNHIGTCTLYWN